VTAVTCRSCGIADPEIVLSLGRQPLANALLTEAELTSSQPTYPLELAFCPKCALVQLTVSVQPDELFNDEYPYFSSFAPTVVANAESIVTRLVEDRQLGSDHLAMELASNDGYLLQYYVAAGVSVLGIDPARNVADAAEARGVRTRCAFFGRQLGEELRADGIRASVLHANNVIGHVPDPNEIVGGIASVLADDGVAVLEMPYIRDLVQHLEFDTIYHEHYSYFSLSSFSSLLSRNGLQLVDVEHLPIHGGSLRYFAMLDGAATPSGAVTELQQEEARLGVDRSEFYADFASRVEALRESLRTVLKDLKAQGHRVAGYASAAKATVLLNALGVGAETIEYIVDRSPHKQGRYVPGARIPIFGVERLLEEFPDEVVIFAWNFAEEIMAQQAEYRARGGRFLIPIPEPHFA
jgi:SAM-dependent methyltransferase